MRGIALLGSTGSIGHSTLEVLKRHREEFRVVALTAGRNSARLEAQCAEWSPRFAGLAAGDGAGNGIPSGPQVLVEAATHQEVDVVVNAVVGAAGLDATLAALRAGKRVALANKETLVMAGDLVAQSAKAGGGEVVPVDSEHSAVLQCLAGAEAPLSRLILTASGGPFREWDADRIRSATVSEALNHPTWNMGHKITVDSATLANKALEVILYALTHPRRLPDDGVRRFDPVAAGPLTFEPVRTDVFRAFGLGVAAGRAGGTAPAVFNAANEVAVAAFLEGRLSFGAIADVIDQVLEREGSEPVVTLEAVRAADHRARVHAEEVIV
jgi:1-deoxy-D-xylulose-5-phosphate reductoisomerase